MDTKGGRKRGGEGIRARKMEGGRKGGSDGRKTKEAKASKPE